MHSIAHQKGASSALARKLSKILTHALTGIYFLSYLVPTFAADPNNKISISPIRSLAPDSSAQTSISPTYLKNRIDVITDVLKITFDSEGATVVRSEFIKIKDNVSPFKNFVLFDESEERVYLAQTGLIPQSVGGPFPNHKTTMTLVSGERTLENGQKELVIQFKSPVVGGLQLIKTYTFSRGAYYAAVRHEVLNWSSVPIAPQLYMQLVRDGNRQAPDSSGIMTFTGPGIYTPAKKYQKVEFSEIENNNVNIEKTAASGYAFMVQRYFASAWILGDGLKRDLFFRKVDTNLYAVGMVTTLGTIFPSKSVTINSRLFIGPQDEKILKPLGLESIQDDGWILNLGRFFKSLLLN